MSEYDVYRRQILMYKDSPCSERVNSFKSKKNVKKIIGLRGNFVNIHTKINLFRSVGKISNLYSLVSFCDFTTLMLSGILEPKLFK